ncbi:hypothetical protein GSI_11009 [Ganoderma sinense ZZ0214-1]|uniref:Uncharacterized protein n=1 Tax=Ganoderma sinense ZZ0214-1 TaxID=1077348 RepID=A0A2G8S267_9APHY|nr:hypothetical protein GSI_11009 [Ganoderma sinense ZZ0214-1]
MSTLYHPRFSVDLILATLPLLDQRTALTVSAANRELRVHARYALLQRPVTLSSDRAIVSFNAFIRQNDTFIPEVVQLKSLDITLSTKFSTDHYKRLKDTLEALTGLQSLTLRNLEVVLAHNYSFRRVLEGLKRLDVLTLESVGPTAVKFLRDSRTTARTVRILDPIWRFPADALATFACEALAAPSCHVPPAPDPPHLDASPVLPALRRLHVPQFFLEPGVGHRAGFMHLAPSLRELDVGTAYSESAARGRGWTAELAAQRTENKRATAQFQLDVERGRRAKAWTKLDVVRGGLVDLLVFGNSTCIDALEIVGEPIADPALQRLVPYVVFDHEPRVLRFSLGGPRFDMRGFERQQAWMETVQTLYVRVVVTTRCELAWVDCQNALANLAFCCTNCQALCFELVPADADAAVREFLAEQDRSLVASEVVRRTANVHFVCVSTPLGPAYWRVGGGLGQLSVLEEPQMEEGEGRRIMTDWNMFSEAYPLDDQSAQAA